MSSQLLLIFISLLGSPLLVEGNSQSAEDSCASQGTGTTGRFSIGEWEEETGFYQSIEVSPVLVEKQSTYQKIEIYDSRYYGRILVLDGVIQLTEKDANAYNEMMAHVPMFQHPDPKTALVIGGGDGYVLSELLKHKSLTHVDHVDLDGDVVRFCSEYFSWGKAWDDPRVTLHIQDGAKFVRNAPSGKYDVIVQDSSDPWTWNMEGKKIPLPSRVLYEKEHVQNIHRILTDSGVFNFQAETFNIPSDLEGIQLWRNQALEVGFTSARYGSIYISSYPTGQIGFLVCEKGNNQIDSSDLEQRFIEMETVYYQPKLQGSAFDLPLWVEKAIYHDNDTKEVSAEETSEEAM